MQLNADMSVPVIVQAGRLAWTPSPVAGVERRMLFRVGGEQAIATSIVRYASHSQFPAHTHPGGEELLVLEGTFEDEHGRYHVGSYVRNPPGSVHAPCSRDGCIIFVRLRQFRSGDGERVVLLPPEHGNGPSHWTPRPLFAGPNEHVALVSWKPRASIELSSHGGLEMLLLQGAISLRGDCLAKLSWIRLPPDVPLRGEVGDLGCSAWVKTAAPPNRVSEPSATVGNP